MDTNTQQRPPVDIEQWLDFIIAAAAHKSHDEAQRKFGEMLIDRYFVTLRDEYKDDPVARMYLDNMLCAVASATRGFSVVRDIFQTNWQAIEKTKNLERARAERLDAFAPFKKDGYWLLAVALISALGLLSPVLAGFRQSIGNLPWILVLALAVGIIVLLIIMELFVDWLRNRRLSRIEERFPAGLYELWREECLRGYREVARQFLLLAIKMREEFYPNFTTLNQRKVFERYAVPHIDCDVRGETDPESNLKELDQQLAEIIEQHFAFKLKGDETE